MVDQGWPLGCASSFPDLLAVSSESLCEDYTDLKTLHKRQCKKLRCLCKRHTISVISINDTKKLYWYNCKSVEEKVNQVGTEGYYCKILKIINGALNTWAHRYIDGLSHAKKGIMFKINGSSKKNMKLLKESCYCHYHPHVTADDCNAEFLKRVVSFDPEIRFTNGNMTKKVFLCIFTV